MHSSYKDTQHLACSLNSKYFVLLCNDQGPFSMSEDNVYSHRALLTTDKEWAVFVTFKLQHAQ